MMPAKRIVWLASYPKSGNTWVRLLLGHLLGRSLNDDGGEPDGDKILPVAGITSARQIFDYHLGCNSYDLSNAEIDLVRADVYRAAAAKSDETMFIKAHDAFQRNAKGGAIFPADCSIAALYMVRDPLDVAVSFAHHRAKDGFDETVKMLNDPATIIGGKGKEQLHQNLYDWSGHYCSWTDQDEIPVMVVRYEDLRADTVGMLARMADFIGLREENFAVSIEAAVEASRFERLQELEERNGFAERPVKAQRFFRSGRSGDGKAELSEQQQQQLIDRHRDVMIELKYL